LYEKFNSSNIHSRKNSVYIITNDFDMGKAVLYTWMNNLTRQENEMTKKLIGGLLLISLFIFCTKAIEQEYGYDVPFVPTGFNVVEQMLKMANVGKDDIVYDLGCGDGRIVITAVKEFGATGIGIDINPIRINESKENSIKEGVADKVQFIVQNLFEADLSEATVVTLYLLPSVNIRLRPKLFNELKPGTRIVSHDFDMGEWKPDQSSDIYNNSSNYVSHAVYFWVLPANVSGTWAWVASVGAEKRRYILQLDQKFQEINGNLTAGGSDIPIINITIQGNRLQFTIEEKFGDQKVTQMFDGLVVGNSFEGIVVSKAEKTLNKTNWKAKRNPNTIIPLDYSESNSY